MWQDHRTSRQILRPLGTFRQAQERAVGSLFDRVPFRLIFLGSYNNVQLQEESLKIHTLRLPALAATIALAFAATACAQEWKPDKPIELIDGANLLYLLETHAGIKARIEAPEDWHDPVPDSPDPFSDREDAQGIRDGDRIHFAGRRGIVEPDSRRPDEGRGRTGGIDCHEPDERRERADE